MNRIKEISFITNEGKVREMGEVEVWALFRAISYAMKKEQPNTIIAIAQGGVWLGHWVRNFFACSNYHEIIASHYTVGGRKRELKVNPIPKNLPLIPPVLIVDDVIETGDTMIALISELMGRGIKIEEIISSTIVWKPIGSKIKPTYFGMTSDKWLIFPWECYEND